MEKTRVFWGIAAFLFLLPACFHGRQSLSVIGYRNQQVFIKKDLFYRVGGLSAGWRHFNAHSKAAAFHNDAIQATISTDAFCGAAFEDLPLKLLTNQFSAGITKRGAVSEQGLVLDGRGALRTTLSGEFDGVVLKFDFVVLKKNNCTVDFVYIAPLKGYGAGVADFEEFYKGFKF